MCACVLARVSARSSWLKIIPISGFSVVHLIMSQTLVVHYPRYMYTVFRATEQAMECICNVFKCGTILFSLKT